MKTCLVCGAGDCEKVDSPDIPQLYWHCSACGFLQMDESCFLNPADEKSRYELHENSPHDAGYVRWLHGFLDFAFATEKTDGKSVLDFGSGPEPVMAGLLQDRGCEVFLEDLYFAPGRRDGKFDVITSVEVFEHLRNPLESLMDLSGRLNPGGFIAVSTEFLPVDIQDFPGWHYRSDPTHISFFSPEVLESLAGRAGLVLTEHDGKRYARFRSLSQAN